MEYELITWKLEYVVQYGLYDHGTGRHVLGRRWEHIDSVEEFLRSLPKEFRDRMSVEEVWDWELTKTIHDRAELERRGAEVMF